MTHDSLCGRLYPNLLQISGSTILCQLFLNRLPVQANTQSNLLVFFNTESSRIYTRALNTLTLSSIEDLDCNKYVACVYKLIKSSMDPPHKACGCVKVTYTGLNVNMHTLLHGAYSFTSEYGVARGNTDPTASSGSPYSSQISSTINLIIAT